MDPEPLARLYRLDKTKDLPLHVQVKDILLADINGGQLANGDRLPPVRHLAQSLGVNVMTVAKAYKTLAELGLVRGRGALGTFVISEAPKPMDHANERLTAPGRVPEANTGKDIDTFRRMLQVNDLPGIIPLTRAYPDTGAVDTRGFEAVIKQTLDRHLPQTYAYISPSGLPSLKSAFAGLMLEWRGLDIGEDDIVVTGGGQQSLSLVAQTVLKPGDVVLVERPTYFGALDLFRSLGATPVGVTMQHDGLDLEELESLVVRLKPALLFINPTFQNPTGITTSAEKRLAILDLCRRHRVPIIEDDCCPELRYRGTQVPSIKSMSSDGDLVYYLSGMGKVYVPGIRLGLVIPPREALERIVKRKSVSDMHTSPLYQEAFATYARTADIRKNIDSARATYKSNLDLIHRELTKFMPDGCEFDKPDGGLNLWIRLPRGMNAVDFYFSALQRNVGILVGEHLYADNADHRTFRLSFGFSTRKRLLEGVRAIGTVVNELAGRKAGPFAAVV